MSEWVKVSEKLPDAFVWVLVISDKFPYPITIASHDGKIWDFADTDDTWTKGVSCYDLFTIDIDDIKFWMPLPPTPEEPKDD